LDLITPLKQVLMQVYVTGSQVEDPWTDMIPV
jgi:hypothetical protein